MFMKHCKGNGKSKQYLARKQNQAWIDLTENDKKMIDLLIDEKYPSLAQSRAKELAEADTDIGELLALHERYKGIFEE